MWKFKVLLQFILSKIPFGEKLNYLLQKIYGSHSGKKIQKRVPGLIEAMAHIDKFKPLDGATVVEIGTGWEAICPVLFYLMGAETVHAYDHIPHLRFAQVQKLVSAIEEEIVLISNLSGIPISLMECRLNRLKNHNTLVELFAAAKIIYYAPGDGADTKLKDNSIDIVFSHAVLEHVPEAVVKTLTLEAKRILKPNGIAYHLIGLHDHYIGFDHRLTKVNFLKYSEATWAFFVKNSISYHNRLRQKQFLDIFSQCGAKILDCKSKVDQTDIDALKDMLIDPCFHGMSHEELAVYQAEIIMSFS